MLDWVDGFGLGLVGLGDGEGEHGVVDGGCGGLGGEEARWGGVRGRFGLVFFVSLEEIH